MKRSWEIIKLLLMHLLTRMSYGWLSRDAESAIKAIEDASALSTKLFNAVRTLSAYEKAILHHIQTLELADQTTASVETARAAINKLQPAFQRPLLIMMEKATLGTKALRAPVTSTTLNYRNMPRIQYGNISHLDKHGGLYLDDCTCCLYLEHRHVILPYDLYMYWIPELLIPLKQIKSKARYGDPFIQSVVSLECCAKKKETSSFLESQDPLDIPWMKHWLGPLEEIENRRNVALAKINGLRLHSEAALQNCSQERWDHH